MKIHFASDHAGFALKETLIPFVRDLPTPEWLRQAGELGYEVEDHGAHEFNEHDDYPELIAPVARHISEHTDDRAIVIGGSGQGEAMVANRFSGVRAAVFYGDTDEIIRLSREHNDANVLALGARFLDEQTAKTVVRIWLDTPFSGDERHIRRITQIDSIRND